MRVGRAAMLSGMSDGAPPVQAYRFAHFELQPHERRLLAHGEAVPLGARAFDLLLVLVARAGSLVTKHELLDAVWPGLVVEEANLSVQVSSLRKALGGELIATIPGRGYRFTGQVEVIAAAPFIDGMAAGESAPAFSPAPASAAPSASASAAEASAVSSAGSAPGPAPASATPSAGAGAAAHAPGLIGRDDELVALSAMLAKPGCVTLVGPAGVGKTTLARALAARAMPGAVWVDLAPLTDGMQVVAAAARALGLPVPEADAAAALRARLGPRLLVLDNGEHVVDAAAAFVSQLLQADPAVHVLATSQLRLAVGDERVHRLEPLALPLDSDTLDLHRGAVAFFVERVRAADHRFHATPAQLPVLREICRRLDGLPLALEMAAARVPALGLTRLAQALERRLAVLTGGRRDASARHRTLQAALDWSHELLGAEEQRLYRTCGVFSGGFSLDLLVAVATGHGLVPAVPAAEPTAPGGAHETAPDEARWAVIDTLSQLVDRSLVAVGERGAGGDGGDDTPRYRLLETMREDARQRLAAAGEEHAARARLLRALASVAHRYIEPGQSTLARRDLLLAEHDNLRETIAWGQRQAAAELRADTVALAIATAFAATFTSWRLEAMHWLDACEPLAEAPDMLPLLRMRWWYERSRQWLMSRHHGARAMVERALALAREVGDDWAEFNALCCLLRAPGGPSDALPALCEAMNALGARHPEWPLSRAYLAAGAEAEACDRLGDLEGTLRCRLREVDLARRMGDPGAVTAAETNVVFALYELGRIEEALQRSRALVTQLGDSDDGNAAYAWVGLAMSLADLGHFEELRAVLPRAARVARLHGLPLLGPPCLQMLVTEGRTADALRVLGHVRARYAAGAMSMTTQQTTRAERLVQQGQLQLGEAAVQQHLADGAAMDEAMVDALVLNAPGGMAAEPARGAAAAPAPAR